MPRLDYRLSLDTVITVVICLLSIGILWGTTTSRIDAIDDHGTKGLRVLVERIESLEKQIVRLTTILEERERKESERHHAN